ncbi:hypothetical protein M408DRAFT_25092 [Serendipita vermifera MAFF 305830]|uniref:F-box domain-containing protein n=1 Tax=Serendipita vermifera MAFF 305830 TaxID=933852 RepID=A0A0C3B3Q1_SERVB|nr:hypothetical protein M408DRAFT_25092 [Serendipita vermifera MAFF 305830]
MDPTSPVRNDKLPFDVLAEVFSYYVTEETIEHPTETLLFVCKKWYIAALARCSLWSQFRIHLAHRPSLEILSRRVVRRLERSGNTVPIDIELRNLLGSTAPPFVEDIEYRELDMSSTLICPRRIDKQTKKSLQCNCQAVAQECFLALLTVFTGYDGVYCARWRHLSLAMDFPPMFRGEDQTIAIALSYPTPNLLSFVLQHPTSETLLFLPYAPSLTQLALNNCMVPSIPNAENLRFLGISFGKDMASEALEYMVFLESAKALTVLKLDLPELMTTFELDFPELQRLELRGRQFPMDTVVSMPKLTHLTLGINGTSLLLQITTVLRESFSQLKSIELWYDCVEDLLLYDMCELTYVLLQPCQSLEELVGDVRMLSIILKHMWENAPSISHQSNRAQFQFLVPLFRDKSVKFKVIHGEEWYSLPIWQQRRDFALLALSLGVINPQEDWSYIYEALQKPWPPSGCWSNR